MRRLSGLVFDQYDDQDGRVLKTFHPDPSDIPDFVKTASRLTGTQIEKLADDQFALVLLDGGFKMKKFAMVDAGNTALSIAYLLKQAHLLPADAVKIAAANLIEAATHYGLGVPEALVKAATDGTSSVSGKAQKPYNTGAKVIRMQFASPHAKSESTKADLGKHDGANADVQGRTNLEGIQGTNFMTFPAVTEKEKTKEASVSMREQGFRYVDVTNWNPDASSFEDHAAPTRTLLGDRYPVDGLDQVKTASAYFAENWKQFHPRDRREYCVKLAARMTELGMELPEDVERYASPGYAADVDAHVMSRLSLVNEEFHPALDILLEKRAQVKPETFAEALAEFDNMTNVRWLWDSDVCDPWKSTFGPSFEKLAEDEWSYNENGVRIDECNLEVLARNGQSILDKQFGEGFGREFAKKPKTVFESLPAPNKLMLARMAMAQHDGTATG
jgi:hypothetical protein